jgi:hypothetical protein
MGRNKTAGVKPRSDDAKVQLEGVISIIANLMHYTKKCASHCPTLTWSQCCDLARLGFALATSYALNHTREYTHMRSHNHTQAFLELILNKSVSMWIVVIRLCPPTVAEAAQIITPLLCADVQAEL